MNEIKLNSVNLSNLDGIAEKITICYTNSDYVIDHMEGEEYFYIRVDPKTNCAEIINSEEEGLSILEMFTNTKYAGIDQFYIDKGSFEGVFSIHSWDDNRDWELEFHGDDLLNEDEIGDLDENEKLMIQESLSPKSVYLIADEVLGICR